MIPGSLTVRVIGTPVGLTFAAAVIVTLPVDKVNWFPVTLVLAAADIVTVPTPKVNGVGVGVTFAAAAIVKDPNLKLKDYQLVLQKLLLVQKNYLYLMLKGFLLH